MAGLKPEDTSSECSAIIGAFFLSTFLYFISFFFFFFFWGGNARTNNSHTQLANLKKVHYLIVIIGLAKGQVLQSAAGIFVNFCQVMTQQLDQGTDAI